MAKAPIELVRGVAGEIYQTKAAKVAEVAVTLAVSGYFLGHYVPPIARFIGQKLAGTGAPEQGLSLEAPEATEEEMYEQITQ